MYSEMPVHERNDLIRSGAHWFAEQRFKLDHPGCSAEEARAYSACHWREYVGQVIDLMALADTIDERDAAVPWN